MTAACSDAAPLAPAPDRETPSSIPPLKPVGIAPSTVFYDVSVQTEPWVHPGWHAITLDRVWPLVQTQEDAADLRRILVKPPDLNAIDAWAAQVTARQTPPAPGTKSRYAAEALAAWFALRVGTWPPDAPTPSEEADLAAAREYFDSVPRGKFRKIRGVKTPASWRKPGPRRGR